MRKLSERVYLTDIPKGSFLGSELFSLLGFDLRARRISLGKDNDDDATIDEVIKDNVNDRTVLQGLLDCLVNSSHPKKCVFKSSVKFKVLTDQKRTFRAMPFDWETVFWKPVTQSAHCCNG